MDADKKGESGYRLQKSKFFQMLQIIALAARAGADPRDEF